MQTTKPILLASITTSLVVFFGILWQYRTPEFITDNSFSRIWADSTPKLVNQIKVSPGSQMLGFRNHSLWIDDGSGRGVLVLDKFISDSIRMNSTPEPLDSQTAMLISDEVTTIADFQSGIVKNYDTLNETEGRLEVGRSFTNISVLSPRLAVVKVIRSLKNELELVREDSVERHSEILTPQQDSIFSTEGQLHYSHQTGIVVYVYTYRNEFICMDTSLNVIGRYHTIDSNSIAKIDVVRLEDRITLATPPLVVNRVTAVYGSRLFVCSSIPGRNDELTKFTTSDVVDVYDIETGKYIHSFHLKRPSKKKLKSLHANNGMIYCLSAQYCSAYVISTH